MSTDETFEIPLEAAEAYERKFVPALFARWAPQLVALAGVSPGHAVLDVACGTGIVARAAADVVGASGTVVGVDRNEAMLEVARRVRPDLAPPGRRRRPALRRRQLRRGAVPDGADVLRRPGSGAGRDGPRGPSGRNGRRAGPGGPGRPAGLRPVRGPGGAPRRTGGPFAHGRLLVLWELDELHRLVAASGLAARATSTRTGTVRLDSVDDFVDTEVSSTPLGQRLSAGQHDRIRREARPLLEPYSQADGSVEVPIVCHLVVAQRLPASPGT